MSVGDFLIRLEMSKWQCSQYEDPGLDTMTKENEHKKT